MLEPLQFFLELREGARTVEGDRLLEHPDHDQPLAPVATFVQRAVLVLADLLEQLESRLPEQLFGSRGTAAVAAARRDWTATGEVLLREELIEV